MIDVESVGAGGGSIAWIDEGGGAQGRAAARRARRPGRSATAAAAPSRRSPTRSSSRACSAPRSPAARSALDRDGGASTGIRAAGRRARALPLDRVVAGIVEIAQENMANAVRSVSIWKGLDPRDLTLVAFGGAGGMVAGRGRARARHPARADPDAPRQHLRDGAADDRHAGGRDGRVHRARRRGRPRRDERPPRRARRAHVRRTLAAAGRSPRTRSTSATSPTSATAARSTS